ncbi:hypothetical protein [Streptomyces sp. CBMA156]|uniref:hypothetical protein n=1 Tax=Streptomyces sp. CBMA156 TaxID=1930280 RepID=UPI0016621B7B|nr:hypothetical protein [Streptomyces sp. CBMA156]MBD0670066.1 hypothetical protein [Streptomyces sp. CBMA156]
MERLWGRWWPVPADTEPIDRHTSLEWWPDQRTAEQALRERLGAQLATIDGIARSTMHLADGRTLTDQQFYGDRRSRIYLYAVTGEPGHDPKPDSEPYGMLEFDQAGTDIVFRNLAGTDSATVRIEVVHQDSGRELYLRDVVVHPWNIGSFGRPGDPDRWTRWLEHVARDGLALYLDIAIPGPFRATATDLDTQQRTTVTLDHSELEPTR